MKGIKFLLSRIFYLFLGFIFIYIAVEPIIRDFINPQQELSYSKTIQLISEKKVESIELYSNNANAEIYLKNDKKRYETSIPSEEVFCQFVQENISEGDDLKITKTKRSMLMRILYLILLIYNLHLAVKDE